MNFIPLCCCRRRRAAAAVPPQPPPQPTKPKMYINQSNEWERRGTLCFLLIPGKLDTYSQGASIQYSKVSKVVQVFVIVTLQSYCCKTSLVIFASLLKSEKSFLINKIQLSLQNASLYYHLYITTNILKYCTLERARRNILKLRKCRVKSASKWRRAESGHTRRARTVPAQTTEGTAFSLFL